MPIEYSIDHEQRIIMAKGKGVFTGKDIFEYQRDVWSHPEVNGYDELVDMSDVEHIALESIENVRDLAKRSARMDPPSSSLRFAIVAPTDIAYGLGRLYETYRGMQEKSTKTVHVFRTRKEAFAFLGIKEPSSSDPSPENQI